MFKLIGALLIIGVCTLTGFFFAKGFGDRCRTIKLWLRILEVFQTEIGYQSTPLPEVFRKTAALTGDKCFSDALLWLAATVEFGAFRDLAEIWQRFLIETGLGILTKDDYLVLQELGSYLGNTERSDQVRKIEACRNSLRFHLDSAENELRKKAGLYRYMGFAVGAVLVLWLL